MALDGPKFPLPRETPSLFWYSFVTQCISSILGKKLRHDWTCCAECNAGLYYVAPATLELQSMRPTIGPGHIAVGQRLPHLHQPCHPVVRCGNSWSNCLGLLVLLICPLILAVFSPRPRVWCLSLSVGVSKKNKSVDLRPVGESNWARGRCSMRFRSDSGASLGLEWLRSTILVMLATSSQGFMSFLANSGISERALNIVFLDLHNMWPGCGPGIVVGVTAHIILFTRWASPPCIHVVQARNSPIELSLGKNKAAALWICVEFPHAVTCSEA